MNDRPTSLIVPLLVALAAGLVQAQEAVDAVANTRTTLEQWVETRSILSKEARDWTIAKEALAARMDVVKREIVAAQRRIADAEASIDDAEGKRRELLATSDRLKAASMVLEQQLETLEQRVQRLLPRLPDPLRERVRPLSQQLAQPRDDARLSLRYANLIGILNEVHKWNRELTVTSEVRAMPDGSSVEVTVLYVGLGQAYYAGAGGRVAGVGVATADAWLWRQQNELAPTIQQAIAVFRNERPAAFVQLPAQVQ